MLARELGRFAYGLFCVMFMRDWRCSRAVSRTVALKLLARELGRLISGRELGRSMPRDPGRSVVQKLPVSWPRELGRSLAREPGLMPREDGGRLLSRDTGRMLSVLYMVLVWGVELAFDRCVFNDGLPRPLLPLI